ncbi:IclR family transcriptional regulator [Cryobacterium tepidiphilum]|uniref:IclR family transcriptional regulator n=1 Tax=Cryobacterium tepidiphilum TaxID=2486026 RepID=A0A3M8LQD8_9MICO|nr:IclR family transcriptional regulator [Cryobacterium tepidiphilum]RNE67072.1 IclR family transcriptional regulator [Cryobacterium tepidiphilum]
MAEASTRTVERALALLAVICDEGGANLASSARATDLSASTAFRLLRTLETSGFVRKDEDGTYRPGSRIIQLGAQSLSSDALVVMCREAMADLVSEAGESVYLSVLGHNQTAVYIAIAEGTHSVRHTSWVGRTIPLSASAAGAVLLDRIPTAGYVVVASGIEADVTAIAAPIRSESRVVASLSIVVPSYRIKPRDIERYGELLVRESTRLSSGLGRPAAAEPVP